MGFHDKLTTRKGALGEQIARRHLESRGLIVYAPLTDGAHLFDFLCANKQKQSIVAAEVKTKPRRLHFPDTGIDVRHFNDYMAIQTKYGIDVFLYFVDEHERRIYGNKLQTLIASREVDHNGKTIVYPLRINGIIYFPLCAMVDVAQITEQDADAISALSTRSAAYTYAAEAPI